MSKTDTQVNTWTLLQLLKHDYGTKCTHSRLRKVIMKRAPISAHMGDLGLVMIEHRVGGGLVRETEATVLSPRQAYLLACMAESECTLDLFDRVSRIERREGLFCTEEELLYGCIIRGNNNG